MAPYFDGHLLLPLLDSLRESGLQDAQTITKEKIAILGKTNMVDVMCDEYERPECSAEIKAVFKAEKAAIDKRKEDIFAVLDNEPEVVKEVGAFFANKELVFELKSSGGLNVEKLAADHGITNDKLTAYYKNGKFKYDCGMYDQAEEMLTSYLTVQQTPANIRLGALWGRLACRILQAKWDETMGDFLAIKEAIERNVTVPLDQIRLRAWLMHWGLFVHCNRQDGVDSLTDLFSDRAYQQTMENLCPWMLRYYTMAVILSPGRRGGSMLRSILEEIRSLGYLYSDPITQFLQSLYTQFDFDEAQKRLVECQELLKNDFFLQKFGDRFTHEARVLICEMYCTINRRVDLSMLSEKLQLTEEEAEKWMVQMVRGSASNTSSAIDAKINSSDKQVIMAAYSKTTQQQVADRTNDLNQRAVQLAASLDSVMKDSKAFIRATH
jgi:translation initiation factor 3 subunit E